MIQKGNRVVTHQRAHHTKMARTHYWCIWVFCGWIIESLSIGIWVSFNCWKNIIPLSAAKRRAIFGKKKYKYFHWHQNLKITDEFFFIFYSKIARFMNYHLGTDRGVFSCFFPRRKSARICILICTYRPVNFPYLWLVRLQLWRDGRLRWSLVPAMELPARPLTAAGCTAAKVARDAMMGLSLQINKLPSCFSNA